MTLWTLVAGSGGTPRGGMPGQCDGMQVNRKHDRAPRVPYSTTSDKSRTLPRAARAVLSQHEFDARE
jgi:hypothetical protein